MCGIVGIVANSPVNQLLYDALQLLQHRGQDAAGITTAQGNTFHMHKGLGLVRDVFRTRDMRSLLGNMGIAHCRYPTAGSAVSSAEAQPFYVNSPFGIVLGHNGNLTNTAVLRAELFEEDRRHVNTSSDSEVLLNVLAHELDEVAQGHRLSTPEIFSAVTRVYQRCRGAYAVVALIAGHGLLAFRDPFGIRPLVIGSHETSRGMEYMVASESVALDALGFTLMRDVEPGEALFVDQNGRLHTLLCAPQAHKVPCIFEFVYLARPDSVMDGISVYETRLRMGELLGQRIRQLAPNLVVDVVIPIPDTSRPSALQLATTLGVPYREGFIKNRYIGRTFIMPGQAERKRSVRQKLNAIAQEFRGKSVLLVDDSIVRGTTSREIVQMARDCGAKQVIFASAAPPVRFPNVYGIDMPTRRELLATGRDDEAIAREIGADRVFYQDLGDLVLAMDGASHGIREFDTSCFNGWYVTGDVDEAYLQVLENRREDEKEDQTQQLDLDFNLRTTAAA
ncbi:amidophosphoribosyltransferase [Ferrovum myxofaciens]|uniref:Amidophosphoribosyltransferase n=1 Tax=Ferrovum myxofaciens TaxID=416213 RepID=A0A9E6MW04_9PROT|nr:amidophosphoribosyltransferase [Ferrovum myxofaciens]QKE39426.1 MAG: amidophosphoribosyltransferase [Ferrovum myxofaciens]QWY74701.1 MAG: amidophosphoribosyltransferase [Ferrovum myxofaciens]QWY77447.1 MAG: amidophosphoribosyltransferase [Ferrovum myxofaciens]